MSARLAYQIPSQDRLSTIGKSATGDFFRRLQLKPSILYLNPLARPGSEEVAQESSQTSLSVSTSTFEHKLNHKNMRRSLSVAWHLNYDIIIPPASTWLSQSSNDWMCSAVISSFLISKGMKYKDSLKITGSRYGWCISNSWLDR